MRRKQLLWRASHRGTREMDLLLGGFAARHIETMELAALGELEAIVATPDPELAGWLLGGAAIPEARRSPTLDQLLVFRP